MKYMHFEIESSSCTLCLITSFFSHTLTKKPQNVSQNIYTPWEHICENLFTYPHWQRSGHLSECEKHTRAFNNEHLRLSAVRIGEPLLELFTAHFSLQSRAPWLGRLQLLLLNHLVLILTKIITKIKMKIMTFTAFLLHNS